MNRALLKFYLLTQNPDQQSKTLFLIFNFELNYILFGALLNVQQTYNKL